MCQYKLVTQSNTHGFVTILEYQQKSIILGVLKQGEEFCTNFFHVTGNKMFLFPDGLAQISLRQFEKICS